MPNIDVTNALLQHIWRNQTIIEHGNDKNNDSDNDNDKIFIAK